MFRLFDPERHFNVHFEPQYNVLSGILNIFLHYEINPYYPEKVALENIPPEKYKKYLEIRTNFVKELASAKHEGLSIGGKSNQIAKANPDFRGKTLEQCLEIIQKFFASISPLVDEIIH